MKKYEIVDLRTGSRVAVVEAVSAAVAKRPYKMCKAVEIRTAMPGETEYRQYLRWQVTCREIAKENSDLCQENYHLHIMGAGDNAVIPMPKYPLTEEETEAAKKYAEFIGVKF